MMSQMVVMERLTTKEDLIMWEVLKGNRYPSEKVIRLMFVGWLILAVTFLYQSCSTTQLGQAAQVQKSNYLIYSGVQQIAAEARINWEDAQVNGTEAAAPYLNDENWLKFVEADRIIVDAHNAYTETLILLLQVTDEDKIHNLMLKLASDEAFLNHVAEIGLKILVDNGVISGVVW